ncbi:glutathione S-transferase N-terminal domain-containing protein [Oceanibaculum pacificum]|uniref:Glutathione S-transferase n=1 Tax=Oceanibaculum pacificum TaxID=580166 RepID=A0A154WGD6_9PROT|nr:glutathione S-transferase N-terminal domain-containing protein [Oceanibaculum pacificum]KZD12556.1 glutathione S-transferase [Oceanibaculum pacificum]
MTITFYDLIGDNGRRMSPYGWRVRMALAHKGLEYELVPIGFTDKDKLAFSGQNLVPIIVDGGKTVFDSWTIACHLEDAYPDRPSLFGGDAGRSVTRTVANWVNATVNPTLVKLIAGDIYKIARPVDQPYFLDSRAKRFGIPLEKFVDQSDAQIERFRAALAPARLTLQDQPYLCGQAAGYADYCLFGSFQWARCGSPLKLLASDDPVYAWRARLLESFDGMPGKAMGFPV